MEETSDFGLHLGEERSSCLSDVSSRSISSEWYSFFHRSTVIFFSFYLITTLQGPLPYRTRGCIIINCINIVFSFPNCMPPPFRFTQ